MVSVIGSKVLLQLHNGGQVHGVVKECVDKQIFFEEGPSFKGEEIKDLKVLEIPVQLQKKKKNKKDKEEYKKYDEFGENINKIKESGDFDFAQSTENFNKQSALKEFEETDSIDNSLRLVGHNKVKTKFDHNEMVLDSVDKTATNAIKSLIKINNNKKEASKGFYYNNLLIPLATPLQLVQAENIAINTYSYSSLLLSETAAIGLTQLIIKILGGTSRISSTNHNSAPIIVIVIGNNKTGARGLATARKLINVGFEVLVYFNEEDEDEIEIELTEQLKLFQSIGVIINSIELLNKKLKNNVPELIIDSIQGYDLNLNDLEKNSYENIIEMINWINNSNASVLSIDIPSGIDSGSGVTNEIFVKSKYIVSFGLILIGLQLIYENGLINKGDFRHYLIDLGIPRLAYKTKSLKKFENIKFVENVLNISYN